MSKLFQEQHHSERCDAVIAALAADRFGVFARADALARGVTSNEIQHRLATRRLTAVHKGVYRISGSPDLWHQRLMAAFLALRSRGVVSHRSAARLQGIVGAAEDPLEFIVPASVDRGRSGLILHTTGALSSQDITTIGPFRVTHPARTLFDLAAVCDADVVEEAVDDALARRLVTPARIRWELGQLRARRRPGVGVVRRLLEAREAGGSESKLETRLLRIIRRAGLPIPVQQYRIWCGRRIVARVDLAYPNERIAIEADGRGIHARPRTWARDIEKMNSLARVGWRFVRFTWTDVHQKPEEIAGTIRDLLGA